MNSYLIGLYVLLTSRVPLPVNTMLFGIATLSAYTLLAPHYDAFTQAGLILPVLCAVFGYVMVVGLNIPATAERFERENERVIGPRAFAAPFVLCAIAIFAPSLEWAQHAISILLGITALLFSLFSLMGGIGLKDGNLWDEARKNAANWHVARLVAMVLGNEMVAMYGTPTEWIIAMCIGPIVLHYLMSWTIIITHPYEDEFKD